MIVALALLAAPPVQGPIRTEVPIREAILSDGTRRYAVPISVQGRAIVAGLDSGSVGLRALPDAAEGAKKTGEDRAYGYGVGTELVGPNAQAAVAVGALANTILIQAVRAIGCHASRPNCPARKVSPADFGIQGNGLPREGFRAILGTGLAAAELPNPLVALGAHRWIIELPRPGEAHAGRLILNPSDEELAGFVQLKLTNPHRDRRNDALQSCLAQLKGNWNVCAPTLIDTGAPGIEIVNRVGPAWPDGTDAYFKFSANDGSFATIQFTSGVRKQASHLTFVRDERVNGPLIRSGLIAYFAYSVLYDADRNSIAVRPRGPYPGGPAVGH